MLSYRPIIFALLALFLISCGKEAPQEQSFQSPNKPPAYGDIIVRGDIGDASNLIPILASDSPSHSIAGFIYNGLFKYDKNMNIAGYLSE